MKKIVLSMAFVLFTAISGLAAEIKEISQPALANLLNQNNGKVVILNFFATWCPPCRVEIPELVKLRGAYPPEKLEIIGLSVDETDGPVPEFLRSTGVNYPVFMAAGDVTGSYEISSVPHNVFYAPTGQMAISEPGLMENDLLEEIVNDLLKKGEESKTAKSGKK